MKTFKELREKTLTPAEIKKREEIAKAMEKDNPDMPMGKKMAIATATAKRVAEGGVKQDMLRRQDMAKLAGLYSKAMKAMPGSPKQKALKKQIDQYRRELGLNESLEEAVKTTHVVIDTANGNKVVATASSEQGAKSSVASAERPPMNIKNKKTLKIVKLKRPVGDKQVDRMVGYPLKEYGGPPISRKDYLKQKPMNKALDEGEQHSWKSEGHYTADGEEWTGPQHAHNGQVMTGKTHTADSQNLYHYKELSKKAQDKVEKRHAKEAVSPAQQAAIAISKKERGEKPEVKEAKDDLFQVNIKGEGGATVRARSEKDAINKAFRKLGIATRFTRDRRFMTKVQVVPAESVEESRAYRDARRGMKFGGTKGMATTKKDRDVEASDDDRKAASKNIIMQLRKAADLTTGANVEFEKGKGKVDRATAQRVIGKFNSLQKPIDKEKFQNSIKSLADIKKILGR